MSNNTKKNKNTKIPFLCTDLKILIIVIVILLLLAYIGWFIYSSNVSNIRQVQREAEISIIHDAVKNYQMDNNGILPNDLDEDVSSLQQIGNFEGNCDIQCGNTYSEIHCINLSSLMVPKYLVKLPFDPKFGSNEQTGYYINKGINGDVIVGSCFSEVIN